MTPPRFRKGEEVTFASQSGRNFKAVIKDPQIRQRKVAIQVVGDPYSVLVNISQVHKEGEEMPSATRGPETRRLAKEARMLGIEGYAKMSAQQLAQAVKDHQKPKRKAPAKSKPAKAARKPQKASKRAPARKAASKPVQARRKAKKTNATQVAKSVAKGTNGNPFRPGCNNYKMAEELLRGGRRIDMIKRLKKSIKLHPWSKPKEEDVTKALDKRLGIAAGILAADFGFKVVRDGRGTSGTIRVFPPGKATGQKAKKKR